MLALHVPGQERVGAGGGMAHDDQVRAHGFEVQGGVDQRFALAERSWCRRRS